MSNINTAEHWDKAYLAEGANTWRRYHGCFSRIVDRIGPGQQVVDVGGGVGVLAHHLKNAGSYPFIIDISPVAIQIASTVYDIPGMTQKVPPILLPAEYDYLVATEFLEHLTDPDKFLEEAVKRAPKAIYSVPNNVLGPDEEPEHQRKYTEKKLRALLVQYYAKVEIESFRDEFITGRVKVRDGKIVPEGIALPTLLAYCEV